MTCALEKKPATKPSRAPRDVGGRAVSFILMAMVSKTAEPCRHERSARGLRQARGLESLLTGLQEWSGDSLVGLLEFADRS